MIFRTIRSRLALSFAGIALLAALVLGAVLLVILRDYYRNQEIAYLRGNAKAISAVVTPMLAANARHDEVQSQIENLAFLAQTRIQIYDPQGNGLYDSGSPQNAKVNLGVVKRIFVQAPGGPSKDMVFFSVGGVSETAAVPSPNDTLPPLPPEKPESGQVFVYQSVQAGGSPFGFQLRVNTGAAQGIARSGLSMVEIMRNPKDNSSLGSVKLSQGPASGAAILASVAQGWLFASVVAILLAALVGWFISRRISAPVRALTAATTRMAQGDLTSRADVRGRDEFGQLAGSFNEMADQVETTVTTLRRFVSDAAHELRTPLTALRTNLDLASKENNARERRVFLARAQAMVQRLEELNANLLDLSRLEANGHGASETTIDWSSLLRERIEFYASQAEQAGLLFETDLPAAAMPVRGDPSQIVRAMDNLVDNACKFTPPDGTVRVQLSEQQGSGVFTVQDTGIGIPAEDLPQVFSRFHRGRNTNTYPGSGLGLAIVKAIAAVHHGSVEAHSDGQARGSLLILRLPIISPAGV